MKSLSVSQVIAGLILALLVSFFSYRFRFLTLGGAIAAAVLGTVIYASGGRLWAIPLLIFFFSSSVFSRRKNEGDSDSLFEKSSTRDSWQVLANGGVGGFLTLLQFVVPEDKYYVAYLGSLAAVTADTWGTEAGMLTRGRAFLITSFEPVSRGTSGGVSLPGTLMSVSGAFVIAWSGWWLGDLPLTALVQVSIAGMAASLLDSLLGATIQAQYRCSRCGSVTEKLRHCDSQTGLFRGFRGFTNDWVNLTSAGAGALVAYYFSVFS